MSRSPYQTGSGAISTQNAVSTTLQYINNNPQSISTAVTALVPDGYASFYVTGVQQTPTPTGYQTWSSSKSGLPTLTHRHITLKADNISIKINITGTFLIFIDVAVSNNLTSNPQYAELLKNGTVISTRLIYTMPAIPVGGSTDIGCLTHTLQIQANSGDELILQTYNTSAVQGFVHGVICLRQIV
jgi:hypothetical protein